MGVQKHFFFLRNTCVLYLRLATHSFVFMGEEEDEPLAFEDVLSRKGILLRLITARSTSAHGFITSELRRGQTPRRTEAGSPG